jgi:molecular chaperone GrpE
VVEMTLPENKKEEQKKHFTKKEEEKLNEMEERLKRIAADFENFKKRTEKEHCMLRESAGAVMAMKLLPVVDEFGLAITHAENASDREFRDGIRILYQKFVEVLKKEGLEEMKVIGERFDPEKHEAVRTVEDDGEENMICEVVQKGYTLKGNVLRHAKVIVTVKKTTVPEKKEEAK